MSLGPPARGLVAVEARSAVGKCTQLSSEAKPALGLWRSAVATQSPVKSTANFLVGVNGTCALPHAEVVKNSALGAPSQHQHMAASAALP